MYDSLTNLEKKSFQELLEEKTREEQERTKQKLKKNVEKLRKQRDQLRMMLEQDEPLFTLDSMLVKKLKEVHWIYRLLGTTVVGTDEKTFDVTFTTSYRGVFHESYAARLQLTAADRCILQKHDLPEFIPCDDLSSWLETGIEEFFSQVHGRLHAFVARREELEAVKTHHKDFVLGEVTATFGLNFLKLALLVPSRDCASAELEVLLTYAVKVQTLPSSVQLIPKDLQTFEEKTLKDWSDFFLTHRLFDAVSNVISGSST